MSKQLTANPVRAVILRSAIGALADDDELHVDPLLRGLTAAWLPGDSGVLLIVDGGAEQGIQLG